MASGRTMDQIARGVGKAPTPFMLAAAEGADAVWHSNRAEAKPVSGKSAARGAEALASLARDRRD